MHYRSDKIKYKDVILDKDGNEVTMMYMIKKTIREYPRESLGITLYIAAFLIMNIFFHQAVPILTVLVIAIITGYGVYRGFIWCFNAIVNYLENL